MIALPFPPSVNALWRNVRGRTLLSAAGRQYRAAGVSAALLARSAAFGEGLVSVDIVAWLPDRRRRDADNMFKAPLDVLVAAGVINDDSQIMALSIRKAGVDRENPRLEVSIRQWEEATA